MSPSRSNRLVVAGCMALYLLMFLLAHIDEERYSGLGSMLLQVAWVVCIAAPLAGAVFAAREWPSLWLVPIVFALFTAIPLLVEEIERLTKWYPVGTTAADYSGDGGMYSASTGVFAAFAWPVAMVAVVAVLVEQRRARRRAEHSATKDPAVTDDA